MNVSVEYIVSVLIIGLVISFSITSISSAVNVNLQPVKEEQLQTVAKRVFDKLLLTQGPPNWPSITVDAEELSDIGLADNSGIYYSLDVNKVMRLTPYSSGGLIENPSYIPPERFGELTGLYENGRWKYGFRLFMRTALNIDIEILRNISNPKYRDIPEVFKVTVTTYDGKRASNAVVIASYYCFQMIKLRGQEYTYKFTGYSTKTNLTNFEGWTIMNFTGEYIPETNEGVKSFPFLLVTAKYYGLQSQAVLTSHQIKTLDLLIIDNYLIASFNEKVNTSKSANHLGAHADITVLGVTSEMSTIEIQAINVTSTGEAGKIVNRGGKNYTVYELEQYVPSDIFVAGIFVESRGREWFAFATKPIVPVAFDLSSLFITGGVKTETLSRIVTLGKNSYYIELTLWRMAE
ncbi:MAG: hypothetical protein QXF82_06330 [Nitrososphaeria archaeon]